VICLIKPKMCFGAPKDRPSASRMTRALARNHRRLAQKGRLGLFPVRITMRRRCGSQSATQGACGSSPTRHVLMPPAPDPSPYGTERAACRAPARKPPPRPSAPRMTRALARNHRRLAAKGRRGLFCGRKATARRSHRTGDASRVEGASLPPVLVLRPHLGKGAGGRRAHRHPASPTV
jgi:hypothetical protein